jgi:integrase
MKLLKQERSRKMVNKMHQGVNYRDDGFVISSENGLTFEQKSISQKWRRTLRKNGLRLIMLHATRNCSISFALASGIAPHTVMKRAGHSNCSITMGIYAKVSSYQHDVAAQIMSDTLFKQAVNN